jgi:hypothetical protein
MQTQSSRDLAIFNCLCCPFTSLFLMCFVSRVRLGLILPNRSIWSYLFSCVQLKSFVLPSLCQSFADEFLPCLAKLQPPRVCECKTNLIPPALWKVLLERGCFWNTIFLQLVPQVNQSNLVLWVLRLSIPIIHWLFDPFADIDCWNFGISQN